MHNLGEHRCGHLLSLCRSGSTGAADMAEDFPILVEYSAHRPNSSSQGATLMQGVFNLINIFVGMGLLSMPYAMKLSGWLGLLAMAALTALFCLSGKLIIRAFDKMPSHQPHTYPALGYHALGNPGRYAVAVFALLEFFGGSCMMLIIMWRILTDTLPVLGVHGISSLHWAVAATCLLILPMLFIRSFKRLSWLNLVGFISTLVVTATMVLLILLDPFREDMPKPPAGHRTADWSIIQACGIFAVSVSGHSSLPVLRQSMAHAQDFDKVLNISFSLMLVVYGTVAGLGYYYFGDSAHTLVTTDLTLNSPFRGHNLLLPGLTVDKLVAACVLLNAYSTYPSLVLVMQDLLVNSLAGSEFGTAAVRPSPRAALAIRLSIFAAGAITAYSAYAILGNVMSLVGGLCSMCCSLLLPSLFYLVLHRHDLTILRKCGIGCVMISGVALLVLIVYQNLSALAGTLPASSDQVRDTATQLFA